MLIIGLTGSIAMGKSFVAQILKSLDIPVFDADLEVKTILEQKEVIQKIKEKFPSVIEENTINKKILTELVFSSHQNMDKLEKIIHPVIRHKIDEFIDIYKAKNEIIVLDIPLLFETDLHSLCDYVIVTVASKRIQKIRVKKRNNTTYKNFRFLLTRQINNNKKAKKADFRIFTNKGKNFTVRQIKNILFILRGK